MDLTVEQFRKIKAVYRLTNEDIGSLVGLSGAQVSRIINGKRTLTKRVANRLIYELQLTPEKLERIIETYDEFDLKKGAR